MNNLILLQETRQFIPYSKIWNTSRSRYRSSRSNRSSLDRWLYPCDVAYYNTTSAYHNEETTLVFLLPLGQLIFIQDVSSKVTEGEEVTICCELNNKEEEEEEEDTSWFQITYIEEIEKIVALSYSGKIVTVSTDSDPTVAVVGVFEQGILTASWSPDKELLLIVTTSPLIKKDDNNTDTMEQQQQQIVLIAMNSSLDIVEEVTLPSTVSTSTQTATATSICWKPPYGHLFAISSIDSSDQIRKIRIYQRDTLSYQGIGLSEDGSGRTVHHISSCPIRWAGSGCSYLLTAIQQPSHNNHKVIFFESNGLRHKEFALPTPPNPTSSLSSPTTTTVVEQVEWNTSSDLLAVVSITTTTTTSLSHDPQDIVQQRKSYSSKVQLFHRRNYHWYLKYELLYNDTKRVSHIQFDLFQPYRLLVTLYSPDNDGDDDYDKTIEWRFYEFCWDTTIASCNSSTAVVIDGTSLLVTPFHQAIVPPPMYTYKLQLPYPILHVTFHPYNSSLMITQLSNGNLCVLGNARHNNTAITDESNYCTSQSITKVGPPQLLATLTLIENCCELTMEANYHRDYDATRLRQFLILGGNSNSLYLLSVECTSNKQDCLVLLQVDVATFPTASLLPASIIKRIPLIEENEDSAARVLRLVPWMTPTDSSSTSLHQPETILDRRAAKVLVHLTDGSLLGCNVRFLDDDDCNITLSHCYCEPLMEPCPWITAVSLSDDSDDTARPFLVVGLSRRHRLYCGEQLLSNAASSFTVSQEFVIYVSVGSKPQLHFLPIPSLAKWDPLSGADEDEHNRKGYEPRQVERGSHIVTVVSSIPPKIILQLPRGNLEVVIPRALTLPFCFHLIHAKKYGLALDVMRRNKIDMNLLVDLHPITFLENISTFLLDCLQRHDKRNNVVVEQLNLFISMLSNEDVTLHKYPIPEWFHFHLESSQNHDPTKKQFDFSCKVNTVCQQMRHIMLQFEENKNNSYGLQKGYFLLSILSSFAKETPPQLENALGLIRDNAIRSEAARHPGIQKSPFLSEKAQSSIQYLAFLADYELLFSTALGMYDYDLAKAVARNSQLDPKVYLPMLKRFASFPDKAMARFEVDMKLGRYERALKNLAEVQCDSPEQEKNHFDMCLNMVEEYQLHKLGLSLFETNKRMHHDIMVSLGERLLKEQKFPAALSAFLAAEPKDIDGAKKAARLCHDWRTYFACCLEQQTTANAEKKMSNDVVVIKQSIAAEVANELSQHASSVHGAEKRDALYGASRILLDYCQDAENAVDVLISGQLWDEARRISLLYSRSDLDQRCLDAAEAYAESCIQDLEERATAFEAANQRYYTVLKIVQEEKRTAFTPGDILDDDKGSVYSATSIMSATSLQSNASRSSVGSATSLSSVISAGTTSTFSLSTYTDVNKHKSKYNQIGKGQTGRKKKKEKKQKIKIRQGSEDELKSLVSAMEQNCIFEDYLHIITETVYFLSRTGKLRVAKKLYESYKDLCMRVETSQVNRTNNLSVESEQKKSAAASKTDDHEEEIIIIGCEKKVDELRCCQLPQDLENLFNYLT